MLSIIRGSAVMIAIYYYGRCYLDKLALGCTHYYKYYGENKTK